MGQRNVEDENPLIPGSPDEEPDEKLRKEREAIEKNPLIPDINPKGEPGDDDDMIPD